MHRREASTQPEVPAPTMMKSTFELWMKGRHRRMMRVGRKKLIAKFDENDTVVRSKEECVRGYYSSSIYIRLIRVEEC